jgi:hypothetical protein
VADAKGSARRSSVVEQVYDEKMFVFPGIDRWVEDETGRLFRRSLAARKRETPQ